MARSIWKGSISFGLVNIPVRVYSAESREEISFHLLDQRNMARVRYKRVNEQTNREVPWEETVRGYEYEEINLSKDPAGRAKLVELTGMFSFPQIVINGEVVGGFRELVQADMSGRLRELAAAA